VCEYAIGSIIVLPTTAIRGWSLIRRADSAARALVPARPVAVWRCGDNGAWCSMRRGVLGDGRSDGDLT
jgi:hypothetical protein